MRIAALLAANLPEATSYAGGVDFAPGPAGLTSHSCHCTLMEVIRSFRHRGLKRLWNGDPGRISAALRDRVEKCAGRPRRRGNWRITFRIEHGNVFDVDLTDYD